MLPSLSALARCFHANASMYVKRSRVCSVISEIHIRYCLKGMFNEKKNSLLLLHHQRSIECESIVQLVTHSISVVLPEIFENSPRE